MYIPKQTIVERGVNFLDVLQAIPPEELRRKQLAIERIAPCLQYGVVSCGSECCSVVVLR